MTMYDRILVPTDGSDGMARVIRHAVDLANAHGASIDAVYVVNSASYAGLPMESSWEGIDEMLRDDADAAVDAVRDAAEPRDVPVTTTVVEGTPSREIVEFAEEKGCDLVVMGTHGRGGIDRLLLGSVAEKVVRASNVPVLTVRVGATPEDDPAGADSNADADTNADAAAQ
jgi:nucleotide-binding universal stress UspA family protein